MCSITDYSMYYKPNRNIYNWCWCYSDAFHHPIFNGLSAWQEYIYNGYWFLHQLLWHVQLSNIQWTISLTGTYIQRILGLASATPTHSTIKYSMDCQPDRDIHTTDIWSCIGYSNVFHHPIFNWLSAWQEHTYGKYPFTVWLQWCVPLSNIQWAAMDILWSAIPIAFITQYSMSIVFTHP